MAVLELLKYQKGSEETCKMASLGQLNSFVGKFISLWKAGYYANFHVTSHGGEARVNLEVGLGRVPDDVVVIPPSTCQGRPGPARQ